MSEGLEEPGECEEDKLLLECLVRDEAGGDGSELTNGLCAQLSNVVSKAEGSPAGFPAGEWLPDPHGTSRGHGVGGGQLAGGQVSMLRVGGLERETRQRRCWTRHEGDRWEACHLPMCRGRASERSGSGRNSHFPPQES